MLRILARIHGGRQARGLASMRSRAEGLGGMLQIESGNGHGTTLEVRIPK
jgi:signal transduction histidine kinase